MLNPLSCGVLIYTHSASHTSAGVCHSPQTRFNLLNFKTWRPKDSEAPDLMTAVKPCATPPGWLCFLSLSNIKFPGGQRHRVYGSGPAMLAHLFNENGPQVFPSCPLDIGFLREGLWANMLFPQPVPVQLTKDRGIRRTHSGLV